MDHSTEAVKSAQKDLVWQGKAGQGLLWVKGFQNTDLTM